MLLYSFNPILHKESAGMKYSVNIFTQSTE